MGYNVATPWDFSGSSQQQEPAPTPAAPKKTKGPQDDDETAAFGGNTSLYQPPAAPKTPWDQSAKPTAQTGTPTSRPTAQGQRAAPASTPSMNLAPTAPAAPTSTAAATRGFKGLSSVPETIYNTVAGAFPGGASGAAQSASDAAGKVGGLTWSQVAKQIASMSRPSVATTPLPGAVNQAATTGTPPAPPDLPISFDEGEQRVPRTPDDVIQGMTPEQRDTLTNILSGIGRSPAGADILGPILKAGGQLPGGVGQIFQGAAPAGAPSSPSSGTILDDSSKVLGGFDANNIDYSKIPGANGASAIMGQLNDVLSNPGAWFQQLGDKFGSSLGFSDLGAQGYMDKVLQSAQDQYAATQGINHAQDVAGNDLYGSAQNEALGYRMARDAAVDPYLSQLGGLTGQTQDDQLYFGNRLHDQLMQTDRDANAGRQTIEGNYRRTADLSNQANAAAQASGLYGGHAVDWNDPNNAIAQANRNLYDQRAAGTRRAGLADAGVLSALGAQANANAFGGEPVTGGMLQAAAGASQNRAAQAFSAAQQRAQDLADQGLSRGYEQTQAAYQRNQDALNRQRQAQLDVSGQGERNIDITRQLTGDQTAAGQRYADTLQGYRNQLQGLYGTQADIGMGRAQENYDLGTGLAGLHHDLAGQAGARDLAGLNQLYGTQQQAYGGKASLADAERTGRLGFTQSILGNIIQAIPETMKGAGSILGGFGEIVPF